MGQPIRLLEAYVPGLRHASPLQMQRAQGLLSAALTERGHRMMLVMVSDDEMLLLLVWCDEMNAQLPDRVTLADAVSQSLAGAIVQRVVDGQFEAT